MADFLTRLASRTLGLTPAAEPAVGPLFASAGVSPDAPPPALDFEADGDAPRAPVERADTPDIAQRRLEPAPPAVAGPAPDQRAPESRSAPSAPAETPAARMALSEDAPLLLRTGQPAGSDDAPPSDRQPARRRLSFAAARPGAPTPAGDAAADEPLLMPLAPPEEVGLSPGRSGPDGLARPVDAVTPGGEDGTPRRGAREQAAAPAPPPTIEITIGRVEVRAVAAAPAPPARPQRDAPRLSLEEYLRSQNGGRR